MKKLDIRLMRMISHSKGQFFSIVAIVGAALSLYVLFNITTLNINAAVEKYYEMTNVNDLQVQLVKIPQSALGDLGRMKGIKAIQGRVSFDVPLKVADPDEKVSLRLISIPPEGERINKLYYMTAPLETLGDEEIVLLEQFAKARQMTLGEPVTPYINGRDHDLKLAGIAASPEFIYLMENEQALLPNPDKFGIGFVSEAFAQSAYGFAGSYNELLITLNDSADPDDMVEAINQRLSRYGVKRVIKLEDQLSHNVLTQKIEGIEKMANVLPVMFLFVGGIIIVIMLSRVVSNDRIPIGVLKALGYSNRHILLHYTKYALAIGLVGSIIGIVLGLALSGPLSQVFVSYFNIPFVEIKIYPLYIFKAVALTSAFCIVSGLLGARAVLKILPADAMRAEAPKSGKRILLERVAFIWKPIAFSWKIVIRNVLRTKRRFIFLAFGLSMAYAINTVPLYMGSTMPLMFEEQYKVYQRMDYSVEFSKPLSENVIADLKHLIDYEAIEPKAEYPFELMNGWRKKNVMLIGLPRDTTMYHFVDTKGNVSPPVKNGILVTEALAKALHVKEDDLVKIRNFIPGKEDVSLPVTGVVKQYLGSNAYMDLETMQKLLLDRNMITGVTLTSTADVKDVLKDVKHVSAVRSSQDVSDAFLEYLDTMIVATNAYMLFGGILGFAIVYNATIIGIAERRMEFASLRVLGFDKSDVFRIVTRENAILAIVAILAGIPLGMAMINAMATAFSSDMMTLPVIYPPKVFVSAAVATFFFVAIAQLAARKKIYDMDFIEALKSRIS